MPQAQTKSHDLFLERADVDYKYCLLPRQCYKTGRQLWSTLAVRARREWTGPGTPVTEDRWYDRTEFLIMRIKGKY